MHVGTYKEFLKRHFKKILILFLGIWYWFSLPKNLFEKGTSTVIFDEKGELLGAKLAKDEQWRFSEIDTIPFKFEQCILQFEDAYFYRHPGFNPISLTKSFIANVKAKKIVRGGSTINMQTIRLSRGSKKRTIYQKMVELILATRLEIRYSKKEILNKYVSHTPYGGNVVGLSAAAWRYYGRSPKSLSWGESATLAVLPNAPSLLYPGKNHYKLKEKRDRLLNKLWKENIIDSITCYLAKQEKIPSKPKKLPQNTQHLLHKIHQSSYQGKQVKTTLQKELQNRTVAIVERNTKELKYNHVHNSACLIIEIDTGNILTYVGNSINSTNKQGKDVDIIVSPRSTGSVLKPFLYAMSIEDALILPQSLLPDIPTQIAGYAPENYNKTYSGAVKASEALARSLNIPAVRLLRDYKYPRFHEKLKKLGLSTLSDNPDRYGLSLILGGAEANLFELTGIYAALAKNVKTAALENFTNTIKTPKYIEFQKQKSIENPIDIGALHLMFEAMKTVGRPDQEMGWEQYASTQQIAWKTGTSFGNRDAWAIGVSNNYAVGIWVGNADGEGRANLTGINSAAPILFDVFKQFNTSQWWDTPYEFLKEIKVCKHSGYKYSNNCEEAKIVFSTKQSENVPSCSFHKKVQLSLDEKYQVTSECTSPFSLVHKNWFVLPPIMEWYYKKTNVNYKVLPPYKKNCNKFNAEVMEIIYPKRNSKLFIPKEINGKKGALVFKIAHSNPNATIFWHIDNKFLQSTKTLHEVSTSPIVGTHILTLVDDQGNTTTRKFEIIK